MTLSTLPSCHRHDFSRLAETVTGGCFTELMDSLERLDHVEWSDAARTVWAKTDWEIRWGLASEELTEPPRRWLPLTQHLLDSAGVVWLLFNDLPRVIRARIVDSFGGDEAQARAYVCLSAGTHDVGKVSSDFASMAEDPEWGAPMPQLCDQMRRQGFLPIEESGGRRFRHDVMGQAAARAWLKDRTEAKGGTADSIASIIGGHHGSCPESADVSDASSQRLARETHKLWAQTRNEFFDTMAQVTGAEQYLNGWMASPPEQAILPLIEGLVIQADWIASAEDLFPYECPTLTSERVRAGWERLRLPTPWTPDDGDLTGDDLFSSRFPQITGGHPNPMQLRLMDIAKEVPEPSLFILEAPMGQGKTEAALMAAEILDRRFGCGGIFFGLPTMATSNPMFHRVLHWLGQVPVTSESSIVLAHGQAALNDEYADLISRTGQSGTEAPHKVQVRDWFLGRKRAMLANHVVGTIDQALYAALQARHVMLRQLGIASKVVIIDEVHAADSRMRVYLARLLQWLGAFHTPVILMSATLPPSRRRELTDAYVQGRTGRLRSEATMIGGASEDAYPRISVTANLVLSYAVTDSNPDRTSVRVIPIDDDLDALIDQLEARLADGGCAGVVRNTIQRAQETYTVLREHFGRDVTLIHSRFLAPHRAQKENRLVEQLGRDGGRRPERLIVVGTQVLEQSLDVDFDLVVTDLAPADLMLQRMGRLQRHRRPRPTRLEEAVCLLTGVTDRAPAAPTFPPGSVGIYGKSALLRAAVVFQYPKARNVSFPADIPVLVAEAYGSPSVPPGWASALAVADDKAHADHRSMSGPGSVRNEPEPAYLLSSPGQLSTLTGHTSAQAPDPDGPSALTRGRALVRDGEDSLEVIALVAGGDGRVYLPEGIGGPQHRVVPLTINRSDEKRARDAATSRIVLPRSFTHKQFIDRIIRDQASLTTNGGLVWRLKGWQQSLWLKGKLVLFFNENMEAPLAGGLLRYDPDLGLIVVKTPTQDKGEG